ncbi:MAG: alpha/beta hydrolase [Crocinitomicaceae bacterium]|nr:alpha/beta hydrolase [Crocinitomicaceae bacterium]
MSKSNSEILNYRVIGNGRPVIFLHGFLEDNSMWNDLTFSKDIQMICIELPGHGESRSAKEIESMFSMAESVYQVIQFLDLESYCVVGHSMGGYVGLELMNVDASCEGLVLLNSNFWNDSAIKLEQRKRVAQVVQKNKSLFLYEAIPNLFFDPNSHDDSVKILVQNAKKMSAKDISIISLAMGNRMDNSDVLKLNSEDVLVIQGQEDSTVKKSQMDLALQNIDVEYFVLQEVGHMAHIENPIETVRLIEKFIQKKRKLISFRYH